MLKLKGLLKSSQYAGRIFCRHQCSVVESKQLKEPRLNIENFADLTARRQAEALCSVMIEVDTKDICGQVYNHCKQFGGIKNAFQYTLNDERNFMLIEYENVDAIKETFKYCGFRANAVNWPNRVLSVCKSKLNTSLSNDAPIEIGNVVEAPVAHILRNAETFDEQVNLLYEHTCITDLSVRLKFISALQAQAVINEILHPMLPNARVYPFGSTMNGFGRIGCDLDMALRFDNHPKPSDEDNALVFRGHVFDTAEDLKKLEGRQVACIASLINYLVPGCSKVSAFRAAKVPIVRYFDTNIHKSVDLSVNNLDGFHMTEYLYAMGMLDPRIRPFIFMIRRWAKEFRITRSNAKDGLTNFQLTYMCLSFLQQLNAPIIPTFDDVMRQIGNNESSNIANIENKPFIFNCDGLQFKTNNSDMLVDLFKQFLEYYESFDFNKHMVTLRTTEKVPKPDISPLYLDNIFDSIGSFSERISNAELASMKFMIRQTLQELEHCSAKTTDTNQDWGLLEILSTLR